MTSSLCRNANSFPEWERSSISLNRNLHLGIFTPSKVSECCARGTPTPADARQSRKYSTAVAQQTGRLTATHTIPTRANSPTDRRIPSRSQARAHNHTHTSCLSVPHETAPMGQHQRSPLLNLVSYASSLYMTDTAAVTCVYVGVYCRTEAVSLVLLHECFRCVLLLYSSSSGGTSSLTAVLLYSSGTSTCTRCCLMYTLLRKADTTVVV